MTTWVLDECNAFLKGVYAASNGRIQRVLEAGGGTISYFKTPEGCSVLGLDISPRELARNNSVHLRIVGDIQRLPIADECMDVVICFNVLEHLERPDQAVQELVRALREGGLLILGCPNRSSLKGLMTWLTPTFIHRMYYRHVIRKTDPHSDALGVFPTPFQAFVSAVNLRKKLAELSIELIYYRAYDGIAVYRDHRRNRVMSFLFGIGYYGTCALFRVLSLGRWRGTDSELLMVGRRARAGRPDDHLRRE